MLEARVARLESDVEYIKRDVGEIKVDLREIKIDARDMRAKLELKINAVENKMDTGFSEIRKEARSDFRITWAGLIAAALGLSGLMAKGFGWI